MSTTRTTTRPVITLRSTAGTGFTYVTTKNRRNDPDRLVLTKYDPRATQRRVPGGALAMKVRNSLRALKGKDGVQVVRRRGRTYLISRRDPRLKARQG